MMLTPLPLLLSLTACTFVTDDDWNAFDADGDGYSVNAEGVGEDCDDHDPSVHPGATESCNDIDDDCDGDIDNGVLTTFYVDADSDGWGNADFSLEACTAPDGYIADNTDCDDGAAVSYPDAPELCDDEDNDCDGDVDEPEDIAWLDWYRDSDGDTYGDPDDLLNDCAQPDGFVADATDCDDSDTAVHPAADELCDRIDNDCDELTDLNDPDLVGDWTWHQDADGDGHGDPTTAVGRCEQPTGYVLAGDDCDDSRGTIHPDAVELCGGLDDDCDGLVDEADPDLQGTATFYLDGDADGYGLASGTASGCTAPLGYAALSGDCDDSDTAYHPGAHEADCNDPNDYNCDGYTGYSDSDSDGYAACEECDDGDYDAHPSATERCDGRDNDCDGFVDEGDAEDAVSWYADADSDGYGDTAVTVRSCTVPLGYVAIEDATDCDDARASTHPGANEWCNGRDDDCDDAVDEADALDAATFYADGDADGYGDEASAEQSCDAPSGYAAQGGDCNDGDSAFHPGAPEADCAATVDYNCDGTTGYTDADGDGWAACEECDDSDARINPDATEVCDGVDDDCDGSVDEADAEDALTWYADADGDGYGDATAITDACSAPSGTVPGASDCDDSDAATHPGAHEYCDGHDDDCDGTIDEDDAADAPTWYGDADADGYGEPTTTTRACAVPSGFAEAATDCDDGATATYPGATEWCDGVDTDCDGTTDEDDALDATTWYADMDGDAYGDPDATLVSCLAPPSFVTDSTDCDDSAPAVNPAATEFCDGVDDDCDGTVDEDDAADAPTWYADVDGDGYGDAGDTTAACAQPTAFVADDADCDDWDATIHPGADESCDGGDDDCDGVVDEDDAVDALTWYADGDGDGYGDPTSTTLACSVPSGFLVDFSDCDDGDAAVHPGADEYCDGVDEDCDGIADEDAVDATVLYADADGDGYGNASVAAPACTVPSGYVADATDCDDSLPGTHPGAVEICGDGVDNDCDGMGNDCGWYGPAGNDDAHATFLFESSSDGLYSAVSGGGDVDGDGFDDLLFGARYEDAGATDAGAAYVLLGPVTGEVPLSGAEAKLLGIHAYDYSGQSVAIVGDLNLDGLDDIAISAEPRSSGGLAYVVFGPATSMSLSGADVQLQPESSGSSFGVPLCSAGDYDGDGLQDLIVADHAESSVASGAGAVYVFLGPLSPGILSASAYEAKFTGEAASDVAGFAASSAGDVDGDGLHDVLIGAIQENSAGTYAGAAYLVDGGLSGVMSLASASAKMVGEAAGDRAGYAVVGVGDLDADGRSEVAVGAPFHDGSRGRAYVLFGPVSGVLSLSTADAVLDGGAHSDFGYSLASVGDTDGDGIGNLVVGSPFDNERATQGGAAHMFSGTLLGSLVLDDSTSSFFGEGVIDQAGWSLSAAGDVDDDGFPDVLIGAHKADGIEPDAGAAFLLRGGSI